MKSEDIRYFEGKYVKLVMTNGFRLNGTIIQINEDNLVFKTVDATSLIKFSIIANVVER